MNFNSITFFIFFAIVLLLYFSLKHKMQNRMLLVASYFFYACWDWRFLSLIFISTLADYLCGIKIHQSEDKKLRKRYLLISVVINLSLLGFFKYYNFFVESITDIISIFGLSADIRTLNIILPVGISFYTFQTMTYSIDIYRKEIKPTKNFLDFALYVSFFPQLVAGPIERAKTLLPQLTSKRAFKIEQFIMGLQLIFIGLFKKVFVADNLAIIVNEVYGNTASSGADYIIATWAFAFQIYGDFAGYSDIARGTAKCLGIELMKNFNQPYFAVNPSDFWRRWHISLSTWLRDYLYIPLGGNKKGEKKTLRNLIITMLLGGLWHGAAWNFILWGFYHGVILAIHRFYRKLRRFKNEQNYFMQLIKAFIMFQFTCFGWIFFRSQGLEQIHSILFKIINSTIVQIFYNDKFYTALFYIFIPAIAMAINHVYESNKSWFQKYSSLNIVRLTAMPMYLKSTVFGILTYLLCFYGAKAQSFIYFQF